MDMSTNPIVSVIIPCYNYAHLLPDTLKNIQQQTFTDWECIIVDDGSTDNSSEVIPLLIKNDQRISYHFQNNSGPAVARNYGLKLAKGRYIQFLDADDLLENKKLEEQVRFLNQNRDCDIVYSGVKYFSSFNPSKLYNTINLDDSKPWMLNLSGYGDIMILPLLKGNIMVINSPLVRKTLFEKFGDMDKMLNFNEDWELWARFAIGNARFCFHNTPDTQALVRVHDSYSKDAFKMFIYGLIACYKINAKVTGKKYRKIMIPKINYHKRIIDEKLIELLSVDKIAAIEKTFFIYSQTNSLRYFIYSKMFKIFPVWVSYLVSRCIFLVHKLKNLIVYA